MTTLSRCLIAFLFSIIFGLFSCSKPNGYLDQKVYKNLLTLCPKKNNASLIVYYFDGDCAFCLAKAKAVETYSASHNLKPILIAKTLNPETFQFNIDKLKITSCVTVEKGNEYEKDLPFIKVTKIDSDRAMFDLDDKFK